MTYEKAGEILDELMDGLPEGIFDGLNGGVSFVQDEMQSDGDELYTMGQYHSGGPMGSYITLYYGSFEKVLGDKSDAVYAKELKRTLYHELTHHVETMAGDRSLERDDERFMEDYEAFKAGEPLSVSAVLFASGANLGLCAAADSLFRAGLKSRGITDIYSGFAVVPGYEPVDISVGAREAAEELGGEEFGRPEALSRDVMRRYDAVFCMTEDEADDMALEYPEFDVRIFALGEQDVRGPGLMRGWKKCVSEIKEGVNSLIDELCAEDGK